MVGIANIFLVCGLERIDESDIENRIVIDRAEAEKYELIHESCVFFITFFQPNISTCPLYRTQSILMIATLPDAHIQNVDMFKCWISISVSRN